MLKSVFVFMPSYPLTVYPKQIVARLLGQITSLDAGPIAFLYIPITPILLKALTEVNRNHKK